MQANIRTMENSLRQLEEEKSRITENNKHSESLLKQQQQALERQLVAAK